MWPASITGEGRGAPGLAWSCCSSAAAAPAGPGCRAPPTPRPTRPRCQVHGSGLAGGSCSWSPGSGLNRELPIFLGKWKIFFVELNRYFLSIFHAYLSITTYIPIIYLRPSFMTTSNCTSTVMFGPSYIPRRGTNDMSSVRSRFKLIFDQRLHAWDTYIS